MTETIWASVKNEGCKIDGFLGSLRKGQQIRWEITDTPTPQKEIILSTRTWIYYKYVKQQENRLEVGATKKMLVEVMKRRTLDKFFKEDNLFDYDSSTKQNDPFNILFLLIFALG